MLSPLAAQQIRNAANVGPLEGATGTGNDSSRASQFDSVGQLTTIIQYDGASPVMTIVDAYAGNGWKTSHNVVTLTGGILTTYTNDAKGRLLGQQAAGLTATFVYDAIDNTLTKWHQAQSPMTMTYDPASRLVTMLSGSAQSTYAFDNNGNMTQEYLIGTGLSVNTFDFENRLTGALSATSSPTGQRSTYSYAGDTGLRRTRQEGSELGQPVHTIVWDASDYIGEY